MDLFARDSRDIDKADESEELGSRVLMFETAVEYCFVLY